jgi:hypothetical protein
MKIIKWDYEPSGMCPVQAEGYFLGYYFYFRARWSTASIEFARSREDWEINNIIKGYRLKKYHGPEAGYISNKEATRLIYKGLLMFSIFWPSSYR